MSSFFTAHQLNKGYAVPFMFRKRT